MSFTAMSNEEVIEREEELHDWFEQLSFIEKCRFKSLWDEIVLSTQKEK